MTDDRAARAVKWANLPGHGHTIAEACAKFGITASTYRKARKTFPARITYGGDELVLAGLSRGSSSTVESLIEYYDWIDHDRLSAEEMTAILDRLVAAGLVRKRRGGYALAREWP